MTGATEPDETGDDEDRFVADFDADGEWEYVTTLPSGAQFGVMIEAEADFISARAQMYMDAYGFTSPSDLADLDQVVRTEMLLWRWDQWLATERKYDGKTKVETRSLGQTAKERAAELRGLKKALGIDRVTQDRAKGKGSPAQRMAAILTNARLLGIHRVRQLDTALELSHELINLVETHDRCTSDAERKDVGVEFHDIVDWIREVYIPEFRAIDEYFLEHEQRYWERD